MEPPRPPSPPSGPPGGTWASWRKVAAPSPPFPARTRIRTRSRNMAQFSHGTRARPGHERPPRALFRLSAGCVRRGPVWLLFEVLGQLGQELDIVLALGEAVEQQLEALVGAHCGEHSAHRPDHLEDRLLEEKLFATGAGALDIYGREDALLGELAAAGELAVAGALEFLVDHVVHARPGVDQARTDDRERAALLDVASSAEEALRRIQGDRIKSAR